MAKRRPRANPIVYQHPDLFVGQSPVRVAIDDLTVKQLKALPRSAFSDDEWDELDYDLREDIYQADNESKNRIDSLIEALNDAVESMADLRLEFAIFEAENGIDDQLRDSDQMLERAKRSGDYEILRDEFGDPLMQGDEFDEAFDMAIREVLSDWNMYEFDIERYSSYHGTSSSYLLYVPVYNQIYVDWNSMLSEEVVQALHEDEVYRAIEEEMEGDRAKYFEPEEIWESLQKPAKKTRHPTGVGWMTARPSFEKSIDYQAVVTGKLKIADALEELQYLLAEYEGEEAEPEWVAAPPEERVVYRFDDGFYVQRLTPSELVNEGRVMRTCVGRDDMGYKDAVRKGEIWILSMRTPSGRPKFTFEVSLDDEGTPKRIKQVLGKANRLPGFDLGKAPGNSRWMYKAVTEEKLKIKLEEVKKVVEIAEELGIDPREVYDLGPAINYLRLVGKIGDVGQKNLGIGKTQFDQVNELLELLGTPTQRENPMYSVRGRTNFDQPYRRAR